LASTSVNRAKSTVVRNSVMAKKKAPFLDNRPRATAEGLEHAGSGGRGRKSKYHLRLYISGTTPHSTRAVQNVKRTCEEFLKGRYTLEVIDVYQQPALARSEQIIAAPTLVKKLPAPLRRMIGDMTSRERLIVGLDLRVETAEKSKTEAT
jgi:circadian clock protein KaiB